MEVNGLNHVVFGNYETLCFLPPRFPRVCDQTRPIAFMCVISPEKMPYIFINDLQIVHEQVKQ